MSYKDMCNTLTNIYNNLRYIFLNTLITDVIHYRIRKCCANLPSASAQTKSRRFGKNSREGPDEKGLDPRILLPHAAGY